jgi:CheY-like chemotaxis protein
MGAFRTLQLRVLVIDDHFINRELITRMLEHLGCTVESAADGMQAYLAYTKTRFDIVFMDCQMPRMDGFQATRSIREHERKECLPRVPIVALTANMVGHDRERCISSGMDEVLAKPITLKQLKALLVHRQIEALKTELDPLQPQAATVEPEIDHGPLDPAALQALRGLSRPGGPNLLVELLSDYVETTPTTLAELTRALHSGDAQCAGQLAHSLKSISATLGARELSELLAKIELEQWAGAKPAPDQLSALEDHHSRTCAALQRLLEHERARSATST